MSHLIAAVSFIGFSCSRTPAEQFEDAVKSYQKGENRDKGFAEIQNKLLQYASSKVFTAKGIEHTDTFVYGKKNGTCEVLYPPELSFPVSKDHMVAYYDRETKRIACSDGHAVKVYDENGGTAGEVAPEEKKKKIIDVASVIVYKDNLIFYRDGRLMGNLLQTESVRPFLEKQSFPPPFSNMPFNVMMERSGDLVSVNVGNVGMYNVSVIDLKKREILLKNRRVSSMRTRLCGNTLYHIAGDTGIWKLVRYTIKEKKSEVLVSFREILDVELFDSGCVVMKKDSVELMDYTEKRFVPLIFPIVFKGRCDGLMLLDDNGKHMLADFRKIYEKLTYLETAIPAFFTKGGDTAAGKNQQKKQGK